MLSDRRRFVMREVGPDTSDLFDIFIIGGGGGGGRSPSASWGLDSWAGAGGAGAYVNNLSSLTLIPGQAYSVVIGVGGVGGSGGGTGGIWGAGGTGGTTSFGEYQAQGGGGAYFVASAGGTANGSWAGAGGSGGGAADGHTPNSGVYEVLGSIGGSNGSDAPVSQHTISRGDGAGDGLPKYLFGDVWLDLYCGGGGGGGRTATDSYAGGAGGGGAGGNPGGDATKYGGGGGGGAIAASMPAGGSGYQGAVFIRKSSGTLVAADFTCTGNWRWYRNNASLGIVEIYGDGVFTLA